MADITSTMALVGAAVDPCREDVTVRTGERGGRALNGGRR